MTMAAFPTQSVQSAKDFKERVEQGQELYFSNVKLTNKVCNPLTELFKQNSEAIRKFSSLTFHNCEVSDLHDLLSHATASTSRIKTLSLDNTQVSPDTLNFVMGPTSSVTKLFLRNISMDGKHAGNLEGHCHAKVKHLSLENVPGNFVIHEGTTPLQLEVLNGEGTNRIALSQVTMSGDRPIALQGRYLRMNGDSRVCSNLQKLSLIGSEQNTTNSSMNAMSNLHELSMSQGGGSHFQEFFKGILATSLRVNKLSLKKQLIVDEDHKIICWAELARKLIKLDLSHTQINNEALHGIVSSFANTQLQALNLQGLFPDTDKRKGELDAQIGAALAKVIASLKTLNLSHNAISPAAMQLIADAIKQSATLSKVILKNVKNLSPENIMQLRAAWIENQRLKMMVTSGMKVTSGSSRASSERSNLPAEQKQRVEQTPELKEYYAAVQKCLGDAINRSNAFAFVPRDRDRFSTKLTLLTEDPEGGEQLNAFALLLTLQQAELLRKLGTDASCSDPLDNLMTDLEAIDEQKSKAAILTSPGNPRIQRQAITDCRRLFRYLDSNKNFTASELLQLLREGSLPKVNTPLPDISTIQLSNLAREDLYRLLPPILRRFSEEIGQTTIETLGTLAARVLALLDSQQPVIAFSDEGSSLNKVATEVQAPSSIPSVFAEFQKLLEDSSNKGDDSRPVFDSSSLPVGSSTEDLIGQVLSMQPVAAPRAVFDSASLPRDTSAGDLRELAASLRANHEPLAAFDVASLPTAGPARDTRAIDEALGQSAVSALPVFDIASLPAASATGDISSQFLESLSAHPIR